MAKTISFLFRRTPLNFYPTGEPKRPSASTRTKIAASCISGARRRAGKGRFEAETDVCDHGYVSSFCVRVHANADR